MSSEFASSWCRTNRQPNRVAARYGTIQLLTDPATAHKHSVTVTRRSRLHKQSPPPSTLAPPQPPAVRTTASHAHDSKCPGSLGAFGQPVGFHCTLMTTRDGQKSSLGSDAILDSRISKSARRCRLLLSCFAAQNDASSPAPGSADLGTFRPDCGRGSTNQVQYHCKHCETMLSIGSCKFNRL